MSLDKQDFSVRKNLMYSDMLAAIRSWHEYWDDTYDGRPLRDYEFKMLEILRKVDQ